jgi:plasmid stabilization system protein ParE
MSYTVDWTPEARSQLAAIWVQHVPHRQAITAAQARIDRLLAANPLRIGKPLAEGLYAIDVPPLRAIYEVSDADQLVTVVSVNWSP